MDINNREFYGHSSFGDVYYLPDGKIGKAKIYMWRNDTLFTAMFKIPKGQKHLAIWRITESLPGPDIKTKTIFEL